MMLYLTCLYLLCCLLSITRCQESAEPSITAGDKTVSGVIGGSVLLECQVTNPSNRSVSWFFMDHNVRISDDLNILITSPRYSIEQPNYSGQNTPGNHTVHFSLEILHLKSTDQGNYRCHLAGHQEEMIYELVISDAKRPTPPADIPIANHTECCVKEGVSAGCLPLCDRSDLSPDFNPSLCAGDVLKLIKCGTDGRNHVSCCRRRQVPVNCLEICTSSTPTIGLEQLICDQYDAQINGCFNEGQVTLPTPPAEVRASPYDPELGGIQVEWLEPRENADLVTGYRVAYRAVQRESPTFQTTEVLSADSRSTHLGVSHGGRYQVFVVAISPHGASLPSPLTEVYTGPDPDVNTTQNIAIRECCEHHNVVFDCQHLLCKSDGYRAMETLNVHYCQNELPQIFHCIVGGQDHSTCCRGRGLPEECMGLCSGQTIAFNQTILPCLTQLQTVEECLLEGFAVLPVAPRGFRVESVGSESAVLEWEGAYAGVHPVERYSVRYRMRTVAGSAAYTEIMTERPFVIVPRLRPETVYEAEVASIYYGLWSTYSPTLIFQTYSEEQVNPSTDAPETPHVVVHPDMAACCQKKSVPSTCLWLCSYDLDFHATLQNNITELNMCSPYIKEMLTCAADNRNHTTCCQEYLVPGDCLFMCALTTEGAMPEISPNCKLNSGDILNCYKSGVVTLPRSPVNVTVSNVTSHSITLEWQADTSGPRPSGYIVQYNLGDILDILFIPTSSWQQDTTNLTTHILQNLKSASTYMISLVSVNENGTSVPGEFISQLTQEDSAGIGFTTPGPATTQHPAVIRPTEPDVNRTECCQRKAVSPECLTACEQADITNTSCSMDVFTILACSADGGDHSSCCIDQGVSTQCRGLCTGLTDYRGNPTSVFCASYADSIVFCTQRSTVAIPSPPTNFKIGPQISSRYLRVSWGPPVRNAEGCTYIIYYAEFKMEYRANRKNMPGVSSPLVLSGLKPNTMYELYAVAQNKHGFSQPSSKHLVMTRAEVPLEAIVHQFPEGIVNQSDSVSLACGFSGSPRPLQFEWYHNSRRLNARRVLDINNVSRRDEGRYSCKISNEIGDVDKSGQYLSIRYKPEVIYVKGDSVPPSERYTAHVTCMFKGHPTRVSWLKDNRPVDSSRIFSQRSRENISNGTTVALLEIGLINEGDYGRYTCNGSNAFGSAHAIAEVKNPIAEVPTVVPSSSAVNMTECCLSNGIRKKDLQKCVSIINTNGIQRNMEIFYTATKCAADGRDSARCCEKSRVDSLCLSLCAGIRVKEEYSQMCLMNRKHIMGCLETGQETLPSPPEDVTVGALHMGTLSVGWNPPSKNPDKVSFYHIMYHRDGDTGPARQLSVEGQINRHNIQVRQEGNYTVWVVAGNSNGQSVNSSLHVLPVYNLIPSAPRSLHGQLISSGVISLAWNHPDSRSPPIDNYLVFYTEHLMEPYSDVQHAVLHQKSVPAVGTYATLENVNLSSEYMIYVCGNNTFGLGKKSNVIYIETGGETKSRHTDSGVNGVAIGISVTVVLLVIIVILLLAFYFFRVRRPSLKEPGAVSFENPGYSEESNHVQIRGLRNDVPDNTLQPAATTSNGPETFDYGKLHEERSASANPDYATPSNPNHSTPHNANYAAPSKPDYATPSKPDYATPSNPAYTTPTNPDYATPTNPDYATPTTLDYATPTNPDYATGPSNPEYATGPSNPDYATLSVTQTGAVSPQQFTLSGDRDNSEA